MSKATIHRPKSHPQWLASREQGIGSSEVASVLGLNPYQTPYALWRYKKGLDAPQEPTLAMRAGHYLEGAVAAFWSEETGREVIKASAGDWLYIHPDKPFLRVSPDRTFWLPNKAKNQKNKGILECKTTQMSIDPENLPKHWFCQLQYQLGVAGLEQGSLAWLCAGREFGFVDVTFVKDFYQWMVEEIEQFWTECILGDSEPALVNSTDVLAKYPQHRAGKAVEVSEDSYRDYCRLLEVRDKIRTYQGEKDLLEGGLKMQFTDAEVMTYAGVTLATWKAPEQGVKLDKKALMEDHPELFSKYCQPYLPSRRFLVK